VTLAKLPQMNHMYSNRGLYCYI